MTSSWSSTGVPSKSYSRKKLRRNKEAAGNPAYPPLAMFKVLLLQRWYGLSDQGMDDALADRISFCRFAGMSFDYDNAGLHHYLPVSQQFFG